MEDDFSLRFDKLRRLANANTKTLAKMLALPKSKRSGMSRRKTDGSRVTVADRRISRHSCGIIMDQLPADSFNSEEEQMLIRGAEWEFNEDPVDVTSDFVKFDKASSNVNRWATYLASYTRRREPVMFAVGLPLTGGESGTVLSGSTEHGLMANGYGHDHKTHEHRFVLGFDEHDRANEFSERMGYSRMYLVGPSCYAMFMGLAVAGSHPCDRSYEIACIAAIANCLRANMTDEFGNEFRTGFGSDALWHFRKFVWSLPGYDHGSLCERVRSKMKE